MDTPLNSTEILKSWPIFRDGELHRLLIEYLKMQVSLIHKGLETSETQVETNKLQGALIAQKKLAAFLLSKDTQLAEYIKTINAR